MNPKFDRAIEALKLRVQDANKLKSEAQDIIRVLDQIEPTDTTAPRPYELRILGNTLVGGGHTFHQSITDDIKPLIIGRLKNRLYAINGLLEALLK